MTVTDLKRHSSITTVHPCDPLCAPSPFALNEEIIALLRKIYALEPWQSIMNKHLLDSCSAATEFMLEVAEVRVVK